MATIMRARFGSACRDEYNEDELCDGIMAGDEVVYIASYRDDWNDLVQSSVGHLTCRREALERDVVQLAIDLAVSQQHLSQATDEAIEEHAQRMRDQWEQTPSVGESYLAELKQRR